jgi:Rrf2 family protein
MMFSKTCNYGIRAVLYIATQERDRQFIPIREISEKLDISFHFLTKILQRLTQTNILVSFKGPNGGVAFARSPESITLMSIIHAIDGHGLFTECVMGLEHCGDDNPCPLHQHWREVRGDIKKLFEETTLAEFSQKIRSNGFRLVSTIGGSNVRLEKESDVQGEI